MSQRPVRHPQQRVGVFVDVQNMYYSAKNLYSAKVDFGKVLKDATAGRPLVRAFAYVIKADVGLEKEFFEALNHRGFEVRMKDLQVFYDGTKKGDWDVGLCMDVVRMMGKIDVMILVSGDGDYVPLLEYAKSLGVKTEVVAFGKTSSSLLVDAADEFLDMCEEPDRFIIGGSRLNIIKKKYPKQESSIKISSENVKEIKENEKKEPAATADKSPEATKFNAGDRS